MNFDFKETKLRICKVQYKAQQIGMYSALMIKILSTPSIFVSINNYKSFILS